MSAWGEVLAGAKLGITVSNPKSLSASNTTASVPLFRITGSVHIIKLYGIVTTVLSSNITAAHWRTNDQTAQIVLTAAAGTTLSSAVVGSMIEKITTAATALTLLNSSAGRFSESAANGTQFQQFALTAKNTANTDIEFTYTTTNTPATGAIQFFVEYAALSADGSIAVV